MLNLVFLLDALTKTKTTTTLQGEIIVEYCEYPETIVKQLESNSETGLTSEQVAERTEKYGPNKLKEKKKKSWIARFFEQFKDAIVFFFFNTGNNERNNCCNNQNNNHCIFELFKKR